MKNSIITAFLLFIGFWINAQNEATVNLPLDLYNEQKAKIDRLEAVEKKVGQLEKDNAVLQHNADSMVIYRQWYRKLSTENHSLTDSVKSLNKTIGRLNKKISQCEKCDALKLTCDSLRSAIGGKNEVILQLTKDTTTLKKQLSGYKTKIDRSQKAVKWLVDYYGKKSLDWFYENVSEAEIDVYSEFFKIENVREPNQFSRLRIIYEVDAFCSAWYNPDVERNVLSKINPKSGEFEGKMYNKAKNYRNVYLEAGKLWRNLSDNIFNERIEEDRFSQIQSKRTCYLQIISFFAEYPNIQNDYPYIFNTFMDIMRSVAENANNFKLHYSKNPFE